MRDQTIKADAGKRMLSLVPNQIVFDVAEVREYGNKKYGDSDSWKRVEIERYIDALYRHLLAYIEDRKGVDAESGIKHYKHLACNAAFICALEAMETDCHKAEASRNDDVQRIIEKHKMLTCDHDWVVAAGECDNNTLVLRCKKCGKKITRKFKAIEE